MQRYGTDPKKIEYSKDVRPYDDDNTRGDSDEFEDGELVGKWRSNGAALEPKWRDGDSVPLVPFNAAKQTNSARHDLPKNYKHQDSSHAVTKPYTRDDDSSRASLQKFIDDTVENSSAPHRPLDRVTNDRYRTENNYERAYTTESESFPRARKQRPATLLTDESRYETTENLKSSNIPIKLTQNFEDLSYDETSDTISSRIRYGDTFQEHPNEYELNDEEYQKPRPRRRRPPQSYDFPDDRAPSYSVTWSTEKYSATTPSIERASTKWSKAPDLSSRRRIEHKLHPTRGNTYRSESMDNKKVSENSELKSLLKMQQIEGHSLSELLQRRNLTLSDLLRGKADIINVLKSSNKNDEDTTEVTSVKPKIFETNKIPTTTERWKWWPSIKNFDAMRNEVIAVEKSTNNVTTDKSSTSVPEDEGSLEKLDSAETEDGQRMSNDNEKLSAIVRLTKPLIRPRLNTFTEKSTVVTSTSTVVRERVTKGIVGVYQNDESVANKTKLEEDEIMEFSDFTMRKSIETTTTKLDDIDDETGSTLRIEHILGTTEQSVTFIPMSTVDSDSFDTKVNTVAMEESHVNDTDKFSSSDSEYQNDGPQESFVNESSEELALGDQPYETTTTDEETLLKNHQIFSTSNKPYEVVVSEIEPEARAEIFELFSSGSSATRLKRLLEARNMSINELIALRQRGSSKLHLAEVLRSRETLGSRSQNYHANNQVASKLRTRDSEGRIEDSKQETTTEDLSDIEIESTTSQVRENETTEGETNISYVGLERTDSETKTERNFRKNVQLLELLSGFDSLPFSIRPELTESPVSTEVTKIPNEPEDSRVTENSVQKKLELPTGLVEIGVVEEIVKDDSIPVEDLKDTFVSADIPGEERKVLSKVRPSIIASGAILGVTLVVFMAIFIVCRIRQKQKYTYRNTFSRTVFQGPVMTARKLSNSSSLNTIMVNVVATSTTKRPERHEQQEIDIDFDKSDIDNDSLDGNDSWDTIPDFMK